MKYAKNINGNLVVSPGQITETKTGMCIYNPMPEHLLNEGFKPMVQTLPECPKWYDAIPKWEEHEEEFIQTWEYVKQPNAPNRKNLIVTRIAEKYDHNDEIALVKKSTDDPDRIAYDNYVEECKSWAAAEIEEYNNA